MSNSNTQIAVVSTAAGFVPESYSLGFGKSVSSSSFLPQAGGVAVILSDLAPYTSNNGLKGLSVTASCAVEGHSETFIALSRGFPGGEGSPAARSFLAAVREAVASGAPVFLAVAGRSGQHFCALSSEPFGVAPVVAAAGGEEFPF